MTQTKHTPGPWKVESYGTGASQYLEIWPDPQDRLGAGMRIAHIGEFNNTEQDKANARLIAAAPELLEALEEIAEGKGPYSRDQQTFANNTIGHMRELARAAIAKAEGGQNV